MNKDMKEAFEDFCSYHYSWLPFELSMAGLYENEETRMAWTIFQAAWEIQQKRVEELLEDNRKMREFIEIVANDGEGQYQWSFTKSARLAKQILAQMGD